MNGKQARNLRKLVANEAGVFPVKEYETKEHPERIVQVGIKLDGSPDYTVVTPTTIRLTNECQRRLYQKCKKLHHSFFGRS